MAATNSPRHFTSSLRSKRALTMRVPVLAAFKPPWLLVWGGSPKEIYPPPKPKPAGSHSPRLRVGPQEAGRIRLRLDDSGHRQVLAEAVAVGLREGPAANRRRRTAAEISAAGRRSQPGNFGAPRLGGFQMPKKPNLPKTRDVGLASKIRDVFWARLHNRVTLQPLF